MSIITEAEVYAHGMRGPGGVINGFSIEANETLTAGQRIHHGLLAQFEKSMDWQWVVDNYAKGNKRRLRNVAMLVLRETLGMQVPLIGEIFGLAKGQVSRALQKTRVELAELTRSLVDEKDR